MRVRETVPDTFLDRADEVINVDVTVEELRNRLREGKIYRPEKVEQALTNFFRKGNLSTLRELALRAVADEVGEKAATLSRPRGPGAGADSRAGDGLHELECAGPAGHQDRRPHCRPAGSKWYAVYVETPREQPGRIRPAGRRCPAAEHPARGEPRRDRGARQGRAAGGRSRSRLPSARASRTSSSARAHDRAGSCVMRGSTLDKFLSAVPDAAVQVVPLNEVAG